jgi:hypothetical protein
MRTEPVQMARNGFFAGEMLTWKQAGYIKNEIRNCESFCSDTGFKYIKKNILTSIKGLTGLFFR